MCLSPNATLRTCDVPPFAAAAGSAQYSFSQRWYRCAIALVRSMASSAICKNILLSWLTLKRRRGHGWRGGCAAADMPAAAAASLAWLGARFFDSENAAAHFSQTNTSISLVGHMMHPG